MPTPQVTVRAAGASLVAALLTLVARAVGLLGAVLGLSQALLEAAAARIRSTKPVAGQPVAAPRPTVEPPRPGPDSAATLTTALTGLGFQKGAVRAFVNGLPPDAFARPLPEQIRDGLRQLAS